MAIEIHFLNFEGLVDVFTIVKSMIGRALGHQGVVTEGDGAVYTATVPGIKELKAGATFMMIPHVASSSVSAALNVNGLGAKAIRRRVSNSTVTTVAPNNASWLAANKPIRVTYDGNYWIADLDRPNANDIYGTTAVENGGTGSNTAPGALTNLGAQAQHKALTATLTAAGWSEKQQTISVSGVTADNSVFPGPTPASFMKYVECGIFCSGQAANKLTFTCDFVPDEDITINVAMFT